MENIDPIISAIFLMLVGAGLTFVAAWYWYEKKAAAEKTKAIADGHDKLVERMEANEKALALLTQSIQPIATAFQKILIDQLTHFHTPEMDAKLVKLGPPYNMSVNDELELKAMLDQRAIDMADQITPRERQIALIFPTIMEIVKDEALAMKEGRLNDVVLVAVDIGQRTKVGER